MSKRIFVTRKEFLQNDIIVTNHSIDRWRERVDPNVTKEEIQSMIMNDNTIYHDWQDFYVLKNDIVLCISRSNNNIILNTVLGKKSEFPVLNNIQKLIRNQHRYGKINFRIH